MIYLGTCGYSFADWKEVFYPPDLPRGEWLSFYSAEFSAVELDFTYYRMPEAGHLRRMAAQTPEGFRFSVKAHQDITHNREKDPAPFAQFRAALVPLQREDKLGAILLQFPYSFANTDENIGYLHYCFEQLPDLPLVVEFRSSGWLTQSTLGLLRDAKVGFCNVDMPQLPGLLPKTSFVTAPVAYVRFHGRNARKWWHHEHAWERYSYSYSEEELEEWTPRLNEMNEQAQNLYAFANNHWSGQAVTTVRQIKMLLEQEKQAS
jgi:uncharacterized protein YecE (DUF72 family)